MFQEVNRIKGSVVNLSNLVWTQDAGLACERRSVFVVQDFENPADVEEAGVQERDKYFWIYCGSERIEYGLNGYPAYLVVAAKDGGYRLERLENRFRERDGRLVFDVLDLPEELNGLHLKKALDFQNTSRERAFNRPQADAAFSKEGSRDLWRLEGWNMVILVIGANFTGKSFFIERTFKDDEYVFLDIFDYQKRTKQGKAFQGLSSREQIYHANELLKNDVVELVRQGKSVVVEQTFFRALRRIDFLGAVRKAARRVPVEVYVMTPTDEQLRKNCLARAATGPAEAERYFRQVKRQLEETFEFPNSAEGFSRIYAVSEHGPVEQKDAPDWERVREAKEELQKERERWETTQAERREKSAQHEKLVRDTEHIRFWHYCEVCGKRELLTADEAFEQGWDYPPRMGKFGRLSPRTCGNCLITGTLWMKLYSGKEDIFVLTKRERETLDCITNEPESLMPLEDEV